MGGKERIPCVLQTARGGTSDIRKFQGDELLFPSLVCKERADGGPGNKGGGGPISRENLLCRETSMRGNFHMGKRAKEVSLAGWWRERKEGRAKGRLYLVTGT